MPTPLSLLHICATHVAADLVNYADCLPLLPFDVQILIANMVLEKKPKPYIYELRILCKTIYKPAELCLKGIPCLSVGGLEELAFLSSLVRLDLSGCGVWLHSLSFLTGLPTVECLNLRDCWRLSGDCLGFIKQLPRLRCLDLENVFMITDAWASCYIPGMASLQALNMSGTNISDEFLDALTYGVRLQLWAAEQDLTATSYGSIVMGSQQYHALDLIFLRLQHTKISEGVIHCLSSLNQLKLLDVRNTDVPGRSLHSIKGKQGLMALPNNSKLLGKTNSILFSVMKGACGCSSKVFDTVTEDEKKKPIWLRNSEKNSVVKLLQEVSLIRNNHP